MHICEGRWRPHLVHGKLGLSLVTCISIQRDKWAQLPIQSICLTACNPIKHPVTPTICTRLLSPQCIKPPEAWAKHWQKSRRNYLAPRCTYYCLIHTLVQGKLRCDRIWTLKPQVKQLWRQKTLSQALNPTKHRKGQKGHTAGCKEINTYLITYHKFMMKKQWLCTDAGLGKIQTWRTGSHFNPWVGIWAYSSLS